MLAQNVFVYDELMNPHSLYNLPFLFEPLMACFKALILGTCVYSTLKKNSDDFLSFALWIGAGILISPNGSTYSLVILIIPFLAMLYTIEKINTDKNLPSLILTTIVLLLICNFPVHSVAYWPLLLKFPRLYLLLIFWIMLARQASPSKDYKTTLIIFILLMILEIFKSDSEKIDNSTYLLSRDEHILLYDVGTRDARLTYKYWDDTGSHEVETNFVVDSISDKDITLKENQIWYKNQQLTHGADRKRKPMLVNGKTIVYLSDKNRGVSFYTLRRIDLDNSM